MFPASVWDAYANVTAGVDGWQAQLDAWEVSIMVVGAKDKDFFDRLTTAGWRTVHADDDGWVLVRSRPVGPERPSRPPTPSARPSAARFTP